MHVLIVTPSKKEYLLDAKQIAPIGSWIYIDKTSVLYKLEQINWYPCVEVLKPYTLQKYGYPIHLLTGDAKIEAILFVS
jgi:hypothetical protein